ncbi:hypothetical protein C8J56DRAFT_911741 [Mycena floridula]|nr:hypothetical protein C8J56DRAFT_911741 [Mycena floridula]
MQTNQHAMSGLNFNRVGNSRDTDALNNWVPTTKPRQTRTFNLVDSSRAGGNKTEKPVVDDQPPTKRARTCHGNGKRSGWPEQEDIICVDKDEEDLGRPYTPTSNSLAGPSRLYDPAPVVSGSSKATTVLKSQGRFVPRSIPMDKVRSEAESGHRTTVASAMKLVSSSGPSNQILRPNLQNPPSRMNATGSPIPSAASAARLPIKRWFFGHELREGPDYLTWDDKQVAVKSAVESNSHTIALLFSQITSFTFSEYSCKLDLLIQFETMKPQNDKYCIQGGKSETFVAGETDGRGTITLLLDNSGPLPMSAYLSFSKELHKHIIDCTSLRGLTTGAALWAEISARSSLAPSTSATLNRSALATLDDGKKRQKSTAPPLSFPSEPPSKSRTEPVQSISLKMPEKPATSDTDKGRIASQAAIETREPDTVKVGQPLQKSEEPMVVQNPPRLWRQKIHHKVNSDTSTELPCLPVKKWILGRKSFDTPYNLTCDSANIIIKGGPDESHNELVPFSSLSSVTYTYHASPRRDFEFVVQIETGRPAADQAQVIGHDFADSFEQGGHDGLGTITLLLDRSMGPFISKYESFTRLLTQDVARYQVIQRSPGTRALWSDAAKKAWSNWDMV